MINNKEQLILNAVRNHLHTNVQYEEMHDCVEEEYIDMFLQCVSIYGYQEFLDLWVYRNKQNNQYIYLRADENDVMNLNQFLEQSNEALFEQLDGTFYYKFRILDEDEIDEDEDIKKLYHVEFMNC